MAVNFRIRAKHFRDPDRQGRTIIGECKEDPVYKKLRKFADFYDSIYTSRHPSDHGLFDDLIEGGASVSHHLEVIGNVYTAMERIELRKMGEPEYTQYEKMSSLDLARYFSDKIHTYTYPSCFDMPKIKARLREIVDLYWESGEFNLEDYLNRREKSN